MPMPPLQLRCFRLFRYLWYFEQFDNLKRHLTFGPFITYLGHAIPVITSYLDTLATIPGKGAILVLVSFFYIVYLVAVMFWNTEGSVVSPLEGEAMCATLSRCYITIMRLCFYDGDGFDFLTTTIDNGKMGQAIILVMFMCFNSMVSEKQTTFVMC